jgi:ABC-type polysaccharide/polyol phosphate export permease
MSKWIRQFHRWMALIFVIVVAGIFTALGMGNKPVQWVYYLPLLPLALLALTGVYLFVLPYASMLRRRQSRA